MSERAALFSFLHRLRIRLAWRLLPEGYVVGKYTYGGVVKEVE